MSLLAQTLLLLAPPLLLLTTYLVYRLLVRRFGQQRGYFFGFVFYWIVWCLLLPLLRLDLVGHGISRPL